MKIHQVVVTHENRYETDPIKGIVIRKDEVLKPGGVVALQDPEFGSFEAENGTFDVPEELGARMCKGPDWYEGPNPFAEVEAHEKRLKRTKAAA